MLRTFLIRSALRHSVPWVWSWSGVRCRPHPKDGAELAELTPTAHFERTTNDARLVAVSQAWGWNIQDFAHVHFSPSQLRATVIRMAKAIERDYKALDKQLVVVGLLPGARVFMADLLRRVHCRCVLALPTRDARTRQRSQWFLAEGRACVRVRARVLAAGLRSGLPAFANRPLTFGRRCSFPCRPQRARDTTASMDSPPTTRAPRHLVRCCRSCASRFGWVGMLQAQRRFL